MSLMPCCMAVRVLSIWEGFLSWWSVSEDTVDISFIMFL